MPDATLALIFPMQGIDRRAPQQRQPPYTTPAAVNVRPLGTLDQRARGGSRPFLSKSFQEQLGTASQREIRMLSSVPYAQPNASFTWVDAFTGVLSGAWGGALWPNDGLPNVLPIYGADAFSGPFRSSGTPFVDDNLAAVRNALEYDATKTYRIDMVMRPFPNIITEGNAVFGYSGTARIFLRMNDTTPNAYQDGVIVELKWDIEDQVPYSGAVRVFSGGTETTTHLFNGNDSAGHTDGTFSVEITGNTLTAKWKDATLWTGTISAPAGKRFGFGLQSDAKAGSLFAPVIACDTFRIQYFAAEEATIRRRIVCAAAGQNFYREQSDNTLVEIGSARSVNPLVYVQATERNQNLYIADHGQSVSAGVYDDPNSQGSIGSTATEFQAKTTGGANIDWTTVFNGTTVRLDDMMLNIFDAQGSAVAGSYRIVQIKGGDNTTLIIDPSAGGAGNVSYRIERGPKVFEPLTNALQLWGYPGGTHSIQGSVPLGCPVLAHYNDRMILAGERIEPQNAYASRQGDPFDWNYGGDPNDPGKAVAFQNSEAGRIGRPINAAIPWTRGRLLWGCDTDLWMLSGDPGFGGRNELYDKDTGIIFRGAWCMVPKFGIAFIGRRGMYLLPWTASAENISRNKIPTEFLNLDPEQFTVTMMHDRIHEGINIFLTGNQDQQERYHWWYDWNTKGFWQEYYDGAHEPLSLHYYDADDPSRAGMLLGGRDGYIRRHTRGAVNDDGIVVEQICQIGPLNLGAENREGNIDYVTGVVPNDSAPVGYSLRVGNNHQDAVFGAIASSGTLRPGRSLRQKHYARGGSGVVELKETSGPWAFEQMIVDIRDRGPQRLRR